jgi:hypothetical protein
MTLLVEDSSAITNMLHAIMHAMDSGDGKMFAEYGIRA